MRQELDDNIQGKDVRGILKRTCNYPYKTLYNHTLTTFYIKIVCNYL